MREVHEQPLTLCDDATDWHESVRQLARSARRGHGSVPPPREALRAWVAHRLGGQLTRSHDWYFTPGTGAMLSWLFERLDGLTFGAVLPTYQRVAAALGEAGARRSVTLAPRIWSTARFEEPEERPDLLVVNPLHSNPVGASLGRPFLESVIEYAGREDVMIVEDDAFRGTAENGQAEPPPLVAMAPGRVLYLGSWTKTLGWPVKFRYVGVPRGWRAAAQTPPMPNPPGSWAAAFAALWAQEHLTPLLARRTRRFSFRRRDMAALLHRHGLAEIPLTGGMHLLVTADSAHAQALMAALADGGLGGLREVNFYTPGQRAVLGERDRFTRIGFSNVTDAGWPSVLQAIENSWEMARSQA